MYLTILKKVALALLLSTSYTQVFGQGKDVSIMSFNVENLFDTKHDEGKDDWTYLPATLKQSGEHKKRCAKQKGRQKKSCLHMDWNDAVLRKKMSQISKVILSVNDGVGPDILLLQEIENISVLEELRTSFLGKANYQKSILLEGGDNRGIDVAILSRFKPESQPKLHKIDFKKYRGKTRSILETKFKIEGKILTVLGVHFPSPRNPHIARVESFNYIKGLAERLMKNSDGLLAAGDFNAKSQEDSRLYRAILNSTFDVSHHIGCKQCVGTNYFKRHDSWSFLDAIILHKGSKWEMDIDSVRVIKHDIHLNKNGSPKRFNLKTGKGVSDHFPIFAKINLSGK